MKRVKFEDPVEGGSGNKAEETKKLKKHTLDSDEDDSSDDENAKPKAEDESDNDLSGEEDGISRFDGEVKLTPFNMKEELEEGRFDKDGHYLFNKNKEVSDNWLDNIDWIKVKDPTADKDQKTAADNSDSDADSLPEGETPVRFDEMHKYKEMLAMMQPKETVKKALQRLGVRISSAERWRRKKLGILEDNSEAVIKLTELANEILTNMGNMNVYEETFEFIERKLKSSSGMSTAAELDMFGDDNFGNKEKEKMDQDGDAAAAAGEGGDVPEKLMWEYKLSSNEKDEKVFGPYDTEQMQSWVKEGRFAKEGVFVRKVGQNTFHTSNRIDFELYLD